MNKKEREKLTSRLDAIFVDWESDDITPINTPDGIVHLYQFLTTGKASTINGKKYVVDQYCSVNIHENGSGDNCILILQVDNGLLIPVLRGISRSSFSHPYWLWETVNSVPKIIISHKGKSYLLRAGDSDILANHDDQYSSGEEVTISHLCIARLLGYDVGPEFTPTVRNLFDIVNKLFQDKIIKVIDFTDDTEVSVKPKESGFTKIRPNLWHRAASIVLKYEEKTNPRPGIQYWLIGQDEGTYFGVELSESVKSVNEAYTSLIPKEIRTVKKFKVNHKAADTTILRQGEWFIVPTPHTQIPPNAIHVYRDRVSQEGSKLDLPRESVQGKIHQLDTLEAHIDKNGTVYARNFQLNHVDHNTVCCIDDIRGEQWYRFVKNTAVRSVSVEGVD